METLFILTHLLDDLLDRLQTAKSQEVVDELSSIYRHYAKVLADENDAYTAYIFKAAIEQSKKKEVLQ